MTLYQILYFKENVKFKLIVYVTTHKMLTDIPILCSSKHHPRESALKTGTLCDCPLA